MDLTQTHGDVRWFRVMNASQEIEQLPTGDYIGRGGEFLYLHVRVKMEVQRKTRREIIDETAAAYTLSTTAYDTEQSECVYEDAEGRRCAVGRCLANPSQVSERFGSLMVQSLLTKVGDEIFKPEYRGQPAEFWSDLQFLHDWEDHWTDKGLSPAGKRRVEKLHANWDEQ